MLVSCSRCSNIHERGKGCKKPSNNREKEKTYVSRFRGLKVWKNKALEIKKRDKFLCQICLLEKYHTTLKYNFQNLEVHHIWSIARKWDYRLSDWNLITLCQIHHKMAENGTIPMNELLEIAQKQGGLFNAHNSPY